MATINSINNISNPLSSTAVTIDPGAAGDSYIQLSINGTGEFRIGVDDTDDSFRISQGSALGTNDTFVMSAAGERTMPLQPAFLAYLPSDDANVTGTGTIFYPGTTTALTEVFDQNGDFNTNGTFTAPVTGRYYITSITRVEDISAAMTYGNQRFATSNRTYYGDMINAAACRNVYNQVGLSVTAIADMDAADTASFYFLLNNGAGDTADAGGATPITYVSGYLMV